MGHLRHSLAETCAVVIELNLVYEWKVA